MHNGINTLRPPIINQFNTQMMQKSRENEFNLNYYKKPHVIS